MTTYITIHFFDNTKLVSKINKTTFLEREIIIDVDNEIAELNNLENTNAIRIPYHSIKYILIGKE
jgi:hypothetical protein